MNRFCLLIVWASIFLTSFTQAQVLFEGYSKITLGEDFIGFVVQRYEYKADSKTFVTTYLTKYNELGGSVTESLVATANEAFEPLQYTYNVLSPQGAKTIEAKGEKGKLKIVTTAKGKKTKRERVLPKGSFFSSFLAYVILKNPQGLKESTKYEYQAIAEEDGEVYKGTATVQTRETYKGIPVYKVVNDFKDAQFVSYTTEKGEMLATMAPQKALRLELTADPAQAMEGLTVSADNLKLLFGNIPEGKINALNIAPPPQPSSSAKNKITPMTRPSSNSPAAGPVTSPVPVNKPSAFKRLELQSPPNPGKPGKQGARPGIGIQTKSKD